MRDEGQPQLLSPKTKLVGLCVARNEADIIEAMIRHNLKFLDRLHVVDNRSDDATPEILAAMAQEAEGRLFWSRDGREGHAQQAIINEKLGNFARLDGLAHVVLLDADECLRGDPEVLRAQASATTKPLRLKWVTYLPDASDDPAQLNPLLRMTRRRVAENPQYYKVTVPAGLIGKVKVRPGNHALMVGNRTFYGTQIDGITLAHFPVRSAEQFAAKVLTGAWSVRWRGLESRNEARHWRELAARIMMAGDIAEVDWISEAQRYAAKGVAETVLDPLIAAGEQDLRYTPVAGEMLPRRLIGFAEGLVRARETERDAVDRPETASKPDQGSERAEQQKARGADMEFQGQPTELYRGPAALTRAKINGKTVTFLSSHFKDVIQRDHMEGRFYEPEELAIISKHMQPGFVFCDIGSNVGNHAVFVGLFLKPAKIFCFEPNPDVIPTLRANIALNGLDDCCDLSFLGYGLGRSDEESYGVSFRQINTGAARLQEGGGDIAIRAADTLLAGQTVDFVKIDVEGMELDVLEGLAGTVKTQRPRVFIEVQNANIDAVKKRFAAWDYELIDEFRRYPQNINFMFVPRAAKPGGRKPRKDSV